MGSSLSTKASLVLQVAVRCSQTPSAAGAAAVARRLLVEGMAVRRHQGLGSGRLAHSPLRVVFICSDAKCCSVPAKWNHAQMLACAVVTGSSCSDGAAAAETQQGSINSTRTNAGVAKRSACVYAVHGVLAAMQKCCGMPAKWNRAQMLACAVVVDSSFSDGGAAGAETRLDQFQMHECWRCKD